MSRFTFKYESDWDNTTVKMVADADSLNDALGVFESFLRGAGYVVDGVLDVVPEEDEVTFVAPWEDEEEEVANDDK